VCKEFNLDDNPKNSICIEGNRFIPINLIDVAGLVPDAHKGRGLGNQFLNDLSRADVLLHIVDATGSLDKSGNRVAPGKNDPYQDISFLEDEINYWVKDVLEREDWDKFAKSYRDNKNLVSSLYKRLSGLKISQKHVVMALKKSSLENKSPSKWKSEEILDFSKNIRKISKPILIIANKIDKEMSSENLARLTKKYKGKIIPCSALAELVLRNYQKDEIIHYIPGSEDFKVLKRDKLQPKEIETLDKIKKQILQKYHGSGVQAALNSAILEIAGLIAVYPVADINNYSDKDGNVLPDVFLIKKGTLLKEFVKDKIHSDLAKHFIYGIDARTKRRLGENYELEHNDIIRIVSAK
jgi:hypothetical protein